ncbi:ubiquitin-conjugating enzyme/RWD-like protein [Limtongia smithiae]|uniref:ubiquitin-conjugating enzyme/RWD-like protein n=1 Tax=Limtongia smithiae TaxID=1125753 RepID=UPI0034D016F4
MVPPTRSSPTVRRIMREAKELAERDQDIYGAPIEDNLFEWHFVIRGPPSSPYEEGYYHGRISLPGNYPFAPPSFRFLQDSGRFEVNREICLSISNFHVEEWSPAWDIQRALVALRAFMVTSADGAIGSLDNVPEATKREIARKSPYFKCSVCGKTNNELLVDETYNDAEGTRITSANRDPVSQNDEPGTNLVANVGTNTSHTETPTPVSGRNNSIYSRKVALFICIAVIIWAAGTFT